MIHPKWKENGENFSFSTECLKSLKSDYEALICLLIQIFCYNLVTDFLNISGFYCSLMWLPPPPLQPTSISMEDSNQIVEMHPVILPVILRKRFRPFFSPSMWI